MLMQIDFSEKKKNKYKLCALKVLKKSIPVNPTLLIIRAALGTILMFLVLMAHELAGIGGMVSMCILFAICVCAPFWLRKGKKLYTYTRRIYTERFL